MTTKEDVFTLSEMVSCFNMDKLQSDWLAGEFRDCNGESNGIELPEDVLLEEGNCSDKSAGSNKTTNFSSTSNDIRIQPLVKIEKNEFLYFL